MTRFFTHYWSNKWFNDAKILEGQPLYHMAGNQFRSKNIKSGDVVYVVSVPQGCLYVVGAIQVDVLCDFDEASDILGSSDLWPAEDYLITQPGLESFQRFHRRFETKILKILNS